MNLKYIVIILGIILSSIFNGCSEEEKIHKDCIQEYLSENDMIEYKNQPLECRFFVELYEWNGRQYFLLGNHCADMITYPTDCDGKRLCENTSDRECRRFYKEAIRIGIVGVGS